MKRIILAAIVAAFAISPAVAQKTRKPAEISVMSYNMRTGTAKDGTNSWQFRCPATIMMLKEEMPDVFGVQEALFPQIYFITENLRNYEYYGVGRDDGKKEGEYMAIIYNKKTVSMSKHGTFWLSETPGKPSMGWDAACFRTATWALMKDKKSGRKFYFVNTHLDHKGAKAREEGLKLIIAKISEINKDGLPVVLTGDFNMTPDNVGLRALNEGMSCTRLTASESDDSITFNGWGRSSKILDYIYYTGFRECAEYKVINRRFGNEKSKIPFISDHFPISARLVF